MNLFIIFIVQKYEKRENIINNVSLQFSNILDNCV